MSAPARAVVFAYHTVGVRSLEILLRQGVEVPLVVTHEDDPAERVWFESVLELARLNDLPVITPADPNTPDVRAQVAACRPDWLFSFYYRHMLGPELLAIPRHGGVNLHGSLLPKYRGRVPVNWAVLHGETQTGASLHRMVDQPDAGELLDSEAVPILPNDTAARVFDRIVCAGEKVLARALPELLAGRLRGRPLDLASGSYFGGRRPEDGRIDWTQPAWTIHNLIRAVAPPYPGAFFDYRGRRIAVLGSYWRDEPARGSGPRLYAERHRWYADCADGRRLLLTRLELDDEPLDAGRCRHEFGEAEIRPQPQTAS